MQTQQRMERSCEHARLHPCHGPNLCAMIRRPQRAPATCTPRLVARAGTQPRPMVAAGIHSTRRQRGRPQASCRAAGTRRAWRPQCCESAGSWTRWAAVQPVHESMPVCTAVRSVNEGICTHTHTHTHVVSLSVGGNGRTFSIVKSIQRCSPSSSDRLVSVVAYAEDRCTAINGSGAVTSAVWTQTIGVWCQGSNLLEGRVLKGALTGTCARRRISRKNEINGV